MKRTISLWLGLLAFALLPALAQTPASTSSVPMGKIHGRVFGTQNNEAAASGTVTLSSESGHSKDYTFNISSTGDYAGEAPAGNYNVRIVMKTQSGFMESNRQNVEVTIVAGQDSQQDIDMSHLEAISTNNGKVGTIHGHVIGPDGEMTTAGTVSLSTDGGPTAKYSYSLSPDGSFSGNASAGKYTIVFRAPDTPANKVVEFIENVRVVAGQDTLQDIDMTRKAFLDKMTPEQRKQLDDMKQKNNEIHKSNMVIANLNVDIKTASQEFRDADNSRAAAIQALGATASKSDVDAKDAEIKDAKYTQIESLMLKDTAAKADASILWADLAQAEIGLKKYDLAAVNYKKALDIEATQKKPLTDVQGLANAGLGEIYARTGKVAEANAAYDAAAKVNPSRAGVYLKNEAVIFYQTNNPAAQAAAADEAIKADPTQALSYYLKGNGLVPLTTVDPKTQKMIAPAGCLEAYEKYLELAPNGPYAAEVKSLLEGFGQKIVTNYKSKSK